MLTITQVADVLKAHEVASIIRDGWIFTTIDSDVYTLSTLNDHWLCTGPNGWYTYQKLVSDALADAAESQQISVASHNLDAAIDELSRLETKDSKSHG